MASSSPAAHSCCSHVESLEKERDDAVQRSEDTCEQLDVIFKSMRILTRIISSPPDVRKDDMNKSMGIINSEEDKLLDNLQSQWKLEETGFTTLMHACKRMRDNLRVTSMEADDALDEIRSLSESSEKKISELKQAIRSLVAENQKLRKKLDKKRNESQLLKKRTKRYLSEWNKKQQFKQNLAAHENLLLSPSLASTSTGTSDTDSCSTFDFDDEARSPPTTPSRRGEREVMTGRTMVPNTTSQLVVPPLSSGPLSSPLLGNNKKATVTISADVVKNDDSSTSPAPSSPPPSTPKATKPSTTKASANLSPRMIISGGGKSVRKLLSSPRTPSKNVNKTKNNNTAQTNQENEEGQQDDQKYHAHHDNKKKSYDLHLDGKSSGLGIKLRPVPLHTIDNGDGDQEGNLVVDYDNIDNNTYHVEHDAASSASSSPKISPVNSVDEEEQEETSSKKTTTTGKKRSYAFIVCGYQGFDDTKNRKPPLGARLVAVGGTSVEDGNWTLKQICDRIRLRETSIKVSFRNDQMMM